MVLPCSKMKNNLVNAQAIDLYNGPFYQVLRKEKLKNTDLFIISAKYGLIRSTETISYYDQKMTLRRAEQLRKDIKLKMETILTEDNYTDVYINLGKIYMHAFFDSLDLLQGYTIHHGKGGIGERLHQLKLWTHAIKQSD